MNTSEKLIPRLTADGSFTFFSDEFREFFHSNYGARQEAELKFVEPTRLVHKAAQPSLKLLDLCYGLGYNTAAALETIWRVNPECQVQLIALEFDPFVPRAAIAHGLLHSWSKRVQRRLTRLATHGSVSTEDLEAQLLLGDARQTIQQVYERGFRAAAIFLDPFSPPHCPQLWTVEFLGRLSFCLQAQGRLATYSCAAAVRTALLEAGLQIGATPPVGRRSPGTVASNSPLDLSPLSQQEREHLQTRAAVPYRDPGLQDSPEVILHHRRIEQQNSILEPTAAWKRRWFLP